MSKPIVHTKKPLPLDWSRMTGIESAVHHSDIFVREHDKLRMKLIVFKTVSGMREFWARGLKIGDLGSKCRGAVHSLTLDVIDFSKSGKETEHTRVDPVFFCVMGLALKWATQEVITHESVHAAFDYDFRHPKVRWPGSDEGDPAYERICYPAGIIAWKVADVVNRLLDENGYER